jgi:ubiquinone/menaquinone biosynthesis C-methylase UbiE
MMTDSSLFDLHADRYDAWFKDHKDPYQAELSAIKKLLPNHGRSLEVGSGSGRFACPLGIHFGLDASWPMCHLAGKRPICMIHGLAERMPFKDAAFDFVLMVTTLCFLKDTIAVLKQIHRILRHRGFLIIAMIEKHSHLGKIYQDHGNRSVFYKEANFYAKEEVIQLLKQANFGKVEAVQTLFETNGDLIEIDCLNQWHNRGAFVVIKTEKL